MSRTRDNGNVSTGRRPSEWESQDPARTDERERRAVRRTGVGVFGGVIALIVSGILVLLLAVQNSENAPFELAWLGDPRAL